MDDILGHNGTIKRDKLLSMQEIIGLRLLSSTHRYKEIDLSCRRWKDSFLESERLPQKLYIA